MPQSRQNWWTPERIVALAELRYHSHSCKDIARKLGTTASAVTAAISRYRIAPKRYKKQGAIA